MNIIEDIEAKVKAQTESDRQKLLLRTKAQVKRLKESSERLGEFTADQIDLDAIRAELALMAQVVGSMQRMLESRRV